MEEEIRKLELRNPVIQRCLLEARVQNWSWIETLERMVVTLAERGEQTEASLLTYTKRYGSL